MTDRPTDGFDQIDPFERQLARGVQAWTDQAVPTDATAIVPVARDGVRSRFRPAPSGGRGPLLVTTALVSALVIAALVPRTQPQDTAQATLPPGATLSVAATVGGNVLGSGQPSTPATPPASIAGPTAIPTPVSQPTLAPPNAATPTPRPLRRTPRPDPGPTDAPHPTWTPAPVFVGLVKLVDICFANDGTEQVHVWVEWNSPVPITEVWVYLDGQYIDTWGFGSGVYEAREAHSRSMEIGSTHTASARFKAGDEWVAGPIDSAPYLVEQGEACPTG